MSARNLLINHNSKEKYFSAFIIGFLCLLLSVLPVMIADGGYFIYYGDFNAQQIHFYRLGNDAVHGGQLGWNWFTDLGSDFLTSYSFYLSGSPFFWLSAIMPKTLATLSMPVLLAVKHGLASMTAYGFIRRFVRSKNAALIGGLLYAFSGFQVFNIFFNHFQDVTAFFPLMLIAMEEHVNNNRKGVFALTVALMGMINYFFFTGQAVFLIIYYLIRMTCPDFNTSWKKFFTLVLEAVLGAMMAAVILLPSAMAILGNYRVSEHLYGQDMVLYNDRTRIPRIIETFFIPSDNPARPNLFKSGYAKWASIGGYLPLFSMVGVITFMKSHKKHWASKLVLICIICAFIPILNSAFYTFNGSYYARWFYMPILIMALMTAQSLDDKDARPDTAIKICAAVIAACGIISFLPTKDSDGNIHFFKLPNDFDYLWGTIAVAAVSLAAAAFVFYLKNQHRQFMKIALLLTSAASIVITSSTVIYGAVSPSAAKDYINGSIKGADKVYEQVSDDNFFRTDISENYDNYPMSWGLPSIRCFQSVVATSIMDFYDAIGIQRDVASRPDTSHYSLHGLLSVKYYYKSSDDENDTDSMLSNFELVDENEFFQIYENKLFVPMGFGYDNYISVSDAEGKSDSDREKLLMKSLVLDDEQIEKYSDILTYASQNDSSNLGKSDYIRFCQEKQQNCSSSFKYDSYGFEAEITLDKPQLVFFSVPYSEGWTAEVNGSPVDVEKVSYGFMAVKADAGVNTITFSYKTPWLTLGIIISITGALILAAYVLICRFTKKCSDTFTHTHFYDYPSEEKISASENYMENFFKN